MKGMPHIFVYQICQVKFILFVYFSLAKPTLYRANLICWHRCHDAEGGTPVTATAVSFHSGVNKEHKSTRYVAYNSASSFHKVLI